MNKNQKIKWLLTASTLTLPLISVACTKNTDNQSQPINKTNDEELLLQELNSEVENSQLEFNETATQEEKNNFVKTPNDFRSLIKKRRKFKNTKFKLLIKSIFLENDQVIVEFSIQDKETQKESKILKKVFSSNDFFEKFNNKNLSIQSIEKEKKEEEPDNKKNNETTSLLEEEKKDTHSEPPKNNPEDPKNTDSQPSDPANPSNKEKEEPKNTNSPSESINGSSEEKEDENSDKKDGTTENTNEEKNLEQIRLGLWNTYKFSLTEKNYEKVKNIKIKALSKIINYLNIDVQGIVELFNPEALIELVKELNTLNTEANWKYVISDYDKGGKNVLLESNSKQHELSGFIYKASKLDAIAFDNNLIGTSYDNSNYKPHFNSDSNLGFVRPPFGVKFKTKGSEKNDFTFVIGHFDSPGVSKENQEVSHKKQGTQELDEAWNLNAAMNWYDHIDGNNNELIFMGDTNIKKNNEALAFEPLLVQNNYKSLLKEDNPTSIGRNFNYSEPYDKIFYKGDLEVTNSDKYDLLAFPESGLWENISSFQEWKNFLQKNDYDYKTETSYISSVISDHAPIYTDLLLNKADLT